MILSNEELIKCRVDIKFFAERILNIELWPHQLEFMESKSKVVVVASARQIGKSMACAVKAIHTAFSKQAKVLVVSPSLRQSGLMFATIRIMIGESELLRGSLTDDTKSYIKLSNGSELWCLPDSPAQIRGFSKVSLVIVDEANFCSQELLRAVQYSLLTVPESQLFMISSPWSTDHWFFRYFEDGRNKVDPTVTSFHYNYTVSPLIDKDYIERIRDKITEEEYLVEIMGQWISDQDAYFDYQLVESCVVDYQMVLPESAQRQLVWVGIDWASRGLDASVVMLLGLIDLPDQTDDGRPRQAFCVTYFEVFKKTPYDDIIKRVIELSKSYQMINIVSELNGVGDMPTQSLQQAGLLVEGLFTTAQSKVNGYGRMKILMERGQLVLPREPELIKQLTNLRISFSETGASMNISHSKQYKKDDFADSLMFAVLACQETTLNTDKNDLSRLRTAIQDKPIPWRQYVGFKFFSNSDDDPEHKPITAGIMNRRF